MKISLLLFLLQRNDLIASAFLSPTSPFAQSSKLRVNNEFDSILGEGTGTYQKNLAENAVVRGSKINTKNIVVLPDSSHAVTLTSSVAAPIEFDPYGVDTTTEAPTSEEDVFAGEDGVVEGEEGSTMNQISDPRLDELIRKKEDKIAMKSQPVSRPSMGTQFRNYMKGKDFGEVFFTVLVPVIAGYYLSKKAFAEGSARVEGKADSLLDSYADEMIFHDGDFEEMKLCHSDYNKKLTWMGTKKSDSMIKRYLEFYAKKKTVSPQAISSLSYVFSLYKLSEEKAAQILCELCNSIPEKTASTGKLLFFGTQILKTKEAKGLLKPIKDILASSYRDYGTVSGEEIVENSQKAMGEAAYRSAVSAAGKDQTDLTVGWEVLGLDKEVATEIWSEVAKEGFVSSREAKYGITARQKYDDKGRKIDEKNQLTNPEEADQDDDEDDEDIPSGNVMSCSECGYTLFIAKGRDFKFFGSGFRCPECNPDRKSVV